MQRVVKVLMAVGLIAALLAVYAFPALADDFAADETESKEEDCFFFDDFKDD